MPVEILGSLSTIDPLVAIGALDDFISLNIKLVPVSNEILHEAVRIVSKTRLNGYDAIHAATMRLEGASVIITENYKDFRKVDGVEVVRPLNYKDWLKSKN